MLKVTVKNIVYNNTLYLSQRQNVTFELIRNAQFILFIENLPHKIYI